MDEHQHSEIARRKSRKCDSKKKKETKEHKERCMHA
jgi:hypothetical protein